MVKRVSVTNVVGRGTTRCAGVDSVRYSHRHHRRNPGETTREQETQTGAVIVVSDLMTVTSLVREEVQQKKSQYNRQEPGTRKHI